MSNPYFTHESLHRDATIMARLAGLRVTMCGAGAVGANLADTLARIGVGHLRVIDRDRVDARNLSTQPWQRTDVGAAKATILANALYKALKTDVEGKAVELNGANVDRLLAGADLIVDGFDNSGSRRLVKEAAARLGLPCVHVGLARDYAEVIWNEEYVVPSDANDDVCDYPLTRTLVMLAVGVAAETIARWAATGQQTSHTITLADFAIRPT